MARVPYRTYYDVLGVSHDANHDAIKIAYKNMSRRCHPDKNPGNAHAVAWQQEVNKAYETLRDTRSRVAYDAKLPAQRRVLNPFTPQYTRDGFDGACGVPLPSHYQPARHYHYGQRPTTDDYWGGTRARAGFDGAWRMPSSADWQPAGYYHSGQRATADDYWRETQARADFEETWGIPSSAHWEPAGNYASGQRTTAEGYRGGTQERAGFDGTRRMPTSAHGQPAGNYRYGQRTTRDEYWGDPRTWHERSTYDSRDPREKQEKVRDQGWDFNNWHETEPSEPGSFSWTENEEAWRQAEEERIKAEVEQEERANAERRRRKAKRRADRDEEQKRINDARVPAQQKKLSEKITALDEDIARLEAVSKRSVLASEAGDGFRTDGEGTDTVDHFAIKLNRRRRVLGETLNIHQHLCRAQRSNGQADEAEDAERELAKAREDLAFRLADEFAREEEDQRAGSASFDEERVHMQQQCHQSDQEKERELQEQYDWNNAASGNTESNGSRITVEHLEVEEIWPGQRNLCGLSSKLQEQADIGANPVPMQLRYRRIDDWLDQVVDEEEDEAAGGHTKENTEHPESPTRPTQASRYSIDRSSETPISNQNPCSSPPQASLDFFNGEPHPPIPPPNRTFFFPFGYPSPMDSKPGPRSPGPSSDPLETNNETFISDYLQTVHKSHFEVHGEFWDFVAGDEANCDFCSVVLPVLQCPRCNLRACSECKTNRGKRSCGNIWEWR